MHYEFHVTGSTRVVRCSPQSARTLTLRRIDRFSLTAVYSLYCAP